MKTFRWFKNRIGKRIYRDRHNCCLHCEDVFKNGLVIRDESHAIYLYDTQNDYATEGTKLNYRDKK